MSGFTITALDNIRALAIWRQRIPDLDKRLAALQINHGK